MKTRFALLFLTACILPHAGFASDSVAINETDSGMRLHHREWVQSQHAGWMDAHGASSDYFIRPGLIADRAARTITVYAEATGLGPDDPVEFILISDTSGHDYEALAVSYARPQDVHQALVFIGMDPGIPFDPSKLRYRPKGERVMVRLQWEDAEGQANDWAAEDLIYNYRTRKSIPVEGFVFTGSQMVENHNGEQTYAAETIGPQSIISSYNEPTTVLDVPRDVPQSEVYGHIRPFQNRQPPAHARVTVQLAPEFADGQKRVMDVRLELARAGQEGGPASMTLTDAEGIALHEGNEVQNVLAALGRLTAPERNVYLEIFIADETTLGAARAAIAPLQPILYAADIPVEPPRAGHLYYRSLFPTPDHRARENRPSQVLEWHVTRGEEGLQGQLIRVHEEEGVEGFKETTWDASTPEALRIALDEAAHRFPVLLTFAPSDMPYGEIMNFLGPALETHGTQFLFLD